MMYLGVHPIDPGSVEGGNFAVTDDRLNPAPIDLDARDRGGAGHALIRFNDVARRAKMLSLVMLQTD
jgi:hypothetical protein